MSTFVGFRLNVKKDADIIEDLEKYKDTTARVKEAYRRAIEAENAPYVERLAPIVENIPKRPRSNETISWDKFPKEPSVKLSTTGAPTSLKANILSNGF